MKIKVVILSIFTFLVPLFFLPLTVEYFETAKFFLLLCFTLIVLFLWGWTVLRQGELAMRRNPFLLPFFIFLVSVIISFIFSQDKILSLYGYYGRFINTLPFYIVIFLLFVGLVNTIKTEKIFGKIITALIIGIDALLIWIVVYHFGILSVVYPKTWEFLQLPNFNMIGSSALIPFLAIVNIVLNTYLFSDLKQRSFVFIGVISLIISSFVFVFSAGSFHAGLNWMPYVFLSVSIMSTLILNPSLLRERKRYVIILLVSLVFSLIIVNVNPFKKSLKLDEKPYMKEVVLDFNFGWKILGGTLSASPAKALFGSGPDTYFEDFAAHRPLEYNATSFWAMRFSRGSGEFIELLTNLGIIPFVCLFVLFLITLRFALNKEHLASVVEREKYKIRTLTALIIVLVLFGFFMVYNTTVWFILVLVLSGIVILRRKQASPSDEVLLSLDIGNRLNITKDLMPYLFFVSIFIFGAAALPFFIKSYISDILYRKSVLKATQNEIESSANLAIRSATWLSRKDYAHRQIATQSLLILEKISSEETPDQNAVKAFLNQTLNEAERMLALSPNNIENWEAASLIYQRLANLTDGQYFEHAVNALNNAISLDPIKPQSYESLGLLYARTKQFDLAKKNLETAINLQPNFYRTYLTLAQIYELEEDKENAIKLLEIAKSLLPDDSEILNIIDEKIEALQSPEPMDEK